ncbi:MAG: cupin domain-containing protein [Saprospiraceae bacterium]|nr:cupin domain-containing protein [Saprospiraceae bacterium]
MIKINLAEALQTLAYANKEFIELFSHGTLSVEVYRPSKEDKQTPHDRDEIYVIISGTGTFFCDGQRATFAAGDFLFVPAQVDHRFEDFTEDFATWVFFYGPKGGESSL